MLGCGASAVVYRAFDRLLQREVALKVLHDDAGAEAKLRAELECSVRADHPNVVSIQEVWLGDARPAMTMELVEGSSFVEAMHRSPRALRGAFVQLLDGLEALHDAGYVHRDLKPANVLVTAEGRVVLVDLGLASGHASVERAPRDLVGTSRYLPPEAFRGGPCSTSSDLYAAGTMLFEALGGKVPDPLETLPTLLRWKRRRLGFGSERVDGPFRDLWNLAWWLMNPDATHRPSARAARRAARGGAHGARGALLVAFDRVKRCPVSRVVEVRGAVGLGRRLAWDVTTKLHGEADVVAWRCDPAGVRDAEPPTPRCIRAGSRARPRVVWIDDAQWIDPTLTAIVRACRISEAPHVLVILASRLERAQRGPLAELVDEVIEVAPRLLARA